jgi:hypothetical protein
MGYHGHVATTTAHFISVAMRKVIPFPVGRPITNSILLDGTQAIPCWWIVMRWILTSGLPLDHPFLSCFHVTCDRGVVGKRSDM